MNYQRIPEKDMNYLLRVSMRYAFQRDNEIAALDSILVVKKYLARYENKDLKNNFIDNSIDEIKSHLRWSNLKDRVIWSKFIKWLEGQRI